MPFATKKPVKIEFMIFTEQDKDRVYNWVTCNKSAHHDAHGNPVLVIQTLNGNVQVRPGEYVIKGVDGEFYPCDPVIFQKTYNIIG